MADEQGPGALDASSPASLSPRVFIIPVCITLVVWYLVGAGVAVARRLFARPPPVLQGTHDADDDEDEGVPVARPAPVAASSPLSRILLLPFMLVYGVVAVVVEAVLHPVRAAKSALDLARTGPHFSVVPVGAGEPAVLRAGQPGGRAAVAR